MQYNESLFGAKQDVYRDANPSQLYCSVASQNSTLSAGLKTGAYQINKEIDDSVFYWLVNSESPYARLSLINLISSGGVNTVNKVDTDAKNEHFPLVLTWQNFKINTNHDVDTTGTLPNSAKNTIPNGRFTQSMFKTQGAVDNPLLYNTNGLSESTKNNNFNKAPFVVDFDYNNIIATIQVGAGASSTVQDLANYNNTADNYINTISLAFYIGEIDDNNTTRVNSYIQQRYINGVNCGGSGNNGMTVVSDYRYKTPDVLRNEPFYYDTDEFNFFQAITTSVFTTALFNGALVSGANLYNVSYYMDDEHWELNDNNNGYRLKKHGNGVYNDDDFNYIRKCVAYLGFWFTDGGMYIDSEHSYDIYRHNTKLGINANEYADSYMIPNHVYQAEIKEGITTGNFTELRIAKDNDQSKWGKDWRKKNGYDGKTPGGGDRPRPTPDPNPIHPNSPGFTLAGKGTQCYALTANDMDEIMIDIFGRSGASYKELVEGLAMFGSDPMGAFISYKWYPFAFNSLSTSPLFLGQTIVNESHIYPIINNTNNSLIEFHGSFWFGKDKNFIHSKKTQCRLYLPFYGFYEISMPLILSQVLDIDFHYNVPDETAVWIISFGNVIYDYLECVPSIEIPLTGNNAAMIAQSKKNTALQIATQVASMAASALTGYAAYRVAGGVTNALQKAGMASAVFASDAGVSSSFGYNFAANAIQAGAGAGATARGLGLAGLASNAFGGGVNIYNTYKQAQLEIANMRVHVPYHGAADATTFLNLEMRPYIQFYTPDMIDGYNETNYKLTVGHACDVWTTLNDMPDNSLCQVSGTADIDITDMEIAEVQELNEILISGFYK